MARRKTLFDDRPVEISELTYIIKHDIAGLNRQLAELQAYAAPGRGRQNRTEEHRGNVVAMLQTNLASTTTSFQEILEVRTQNMKASKDRSEQILQNPAPLAAEQQRTQSPLYNLARSSSAAASSGAVATPIETVTVPTVGMLVEARALRIRSAASTRTTVGTP